EQVLVAYEDSSAVFATLVSSGKADTEATRTPTGIYPVWGTAASITMQSRPGEPPYFIDQVPWAIFFQGAIALHGAYWHERFGIAGSQGCVNLAPADAKWVFEWLTPLPTGWTGQRFRTGGSTIVIRDSSKQDPLAQERPPGPPHR